MCWHFKPLSIKRKGHVLATAAALAVLCFALGRLSGGRSGPPTPLALSPPACRHSRSIKVFDKMYAKGIWSNVRIAGVTPRRYYTYGSTAIRRALSGAGSNTGRNTHASLHFLADVIANYSVRTVLDVPCGDVNWQMDAYEVEAAELYVGADVVPAIIDLNRRRFKHHLNKRFVLWDLVQCPLPRVVRGYKRVPFDLIHARDVLQHLKLDDAARASRHLLHSGARLLIANTYPVRTNVEIGRNGEWYMNNLEKPPFNFPKPIACVPTHPFLEPDLICLYKLR